MIDNSALLQMATAPEVTDTFLDQIDQIKQDIKTRVERLIENVRESEGELLDQLDEIRATHKKDIDQYKQSNSDLEEMLDPTKEMQYIELKKLRDSFVQKLTEKKEEFKIRVESKDVTIDWDEGLLKSIGKLGVLKVSNAPVVDSTGGPRPVANFGTEGSGDGQFRNPWGLGIHYESGKIYVADQSNNRLQVFDAEGKYLKEIAVFKQKPKFCESRMNNPLSIALTEDRILVTQSQAGCVLVLNLNGEYKSEFGKVGHANGQFDHPYGIAANKFNGNIYVCDYNNNRIQIFLHEKIEKTESFTYWTHFVLNKPININVTEHYIHVITGNHPFLFTFDHNFTQVQQSISLSIAKHLERPYGFCIDGAGRFIFSDHKKDLILIFDKGGSLLSKLDTNIKKPAGIAIDEKGRIVVVTQKPCILIFSEQTLLL